MCMQDLRDVLRGLGLDVTASQIRWAITSSKISRPRLDGSLRFDFDDSHVRALRTYFNDKMIKPEQAPVLAIQEAAAIGSHC
jgi:hypothetical protein